MATEDTSRPLSPRDRLPQRNGDFRVPGVVERYNPGTDHRLLQRFSGGPRHPSGEADDKGSIDGF
ncbi:protein of unknown function [Methylococcus capsulatus]|uniref:Uncharacterized protein n=1 Tax=Methylococcus capsulatus TaxID=414 RepID=A0AA35UPY6_METCP|nr:protein of unknown function [Methylococcus capsulatus]